MSLFPDLEKAPDEGGEDPAPAPKAPAPSSEYLALARKYRPGAFNEVVGQEAVCATLRNAIASGRLHHAYLFSGIRGIGKTTVARLFARSLNCAQGPTPDPCGTCDPCREIAAGLSLDVIEIDAASNRGVDDVEPLREAARYAPSRDRYKIFILDEVHMLSNAAFNSLLKILEEPPPRIVWILATTEYRKVPPTVVSRCQHFEFRRVPRPEVAGYLERIAAAEGAAVEGKGLEILAGAAGGSVRDAVSLLDQVIAYAGARASEEDVRRAIGVIDRRLLLEYLRLVAARDGAKLLELIGSLAEGGTDFSQFAAGLVSTIRDAALIHFAGPDSKAVALTEEESRELREIATGFGEDALLRIFNAILELPGLLRGSPHPRFALEAASLRLTRLADLAPIEEVIASLQRAGPPSEPPAAGSSSSRTEPRSTDPTSTTGASAGASSPPPAERPAGADAEAETAGNGEKSWRARFLASLQDRRLSLRTFLEGARRLTIKESTLEIAFAPSQLFILRSLEAPESRKLIEEAASEAAGRPLSISIVVDGSDGGDGDGGEKAAPAGPGKRERMLQAALAQPGVKMVMDAFSGRIVDIKESN